MSVKLKPCPHCGDEFPVLRHFGSTDTYAIQCNHCQTLFSLDCTGGHDRDKDKTIEAWNRRADDEH